MCTASYRCVNTGRNDKQVIVTSRFRIQISAEGRIGFKIINMFENITPHTIVTDTLLTQGSLHPCHLKEHSVATQKLATNLLQRSYLL